MKLLAFNIKGETAFFKTNAFNAGDVYFTYGQMHKVALLGILGAKIGLNGHSKAYLLKENGYVHPEFYTKLKDLKIAIIPKSPNFMFAKKEYTFTNNCGYSKATTYAQTLTYTEQWLHDVSWDIYLDTSRVDLEIAQKLEDYILNNKCVYPIYLGKTNHFATISEGRVIDAKEIDRSEEIVISGLFKQEIIAEITADIFDDSQIYVDIREKLPSGYVDDCCSYKTDTYCLTNKDILLKDTDVYTLVSVDNINICLL